MYFLPSYTDTFSVFACTDRQTDRQTESHTARTDATKHFCFASYGWRAEKNLDMKKASPI